MFRVQDSHLCISRENSLGARMTYASSRTFELGSSLDGDSFLIRA
jgi:hypothetical protein